MQNTRIDILYPFGELFVSQRNSTFDSRYKFSAKELDNETGYSYFGARYYDSNLSIWLSVDPLSDKYPSLSPYAYCANNPVILKDPNGMSIDEWDFDVETGKSTYVSNKGGDNTQHINFKYKGETISTSFATTKSEANVFQFENKQIVYSAKKDFEYTGEAITDVLYWKVEEILQKGTYRADFFVDGSRIGSFTFEIKK